MRCVLFVYFVIIAFPTNTNYHEKVMCAQCFCISFTVNPYFHQINVYSITFGYMRYLLTFS